MFRPYERCAPSDIILGASVPPLQPCSSAQAPPRQPPRPATAPPTPSGRGSPSSGCAPRGWRAAAEWLPREHQHHDPQQDPHQDEYGVRRPIELAPRGTLVGGTATASAAARVGSSRRAASAYDFDWGEPDYDLSWGEPEPTEVMFGDPVLRLQQLADVERRVLLAPTPPRPRPNPAPSPRPSPHPLTPALPPALIPALTPALIPALNPLVTPALPSPLPSPSPSR